MTMMTIMMIVMKLVSVRSARQRAEIKSRQCVLRQPLGGAADLQTSNHSDQCQVNIHLQAIVHAKHTA